MDGQIESQLSLSRAERLYKLTFPALLCAPVSADYFGAGIVAAADQYY